MSTRKPKALAKAYAQREVVEEIGPVKRGLLLCAGDVTPGQTLPRSVSS